MLQAYKEMLEKYADFKTTSDLKQYWLAILFNVVIFLAIDLLETFFSINLLLIKYVYSIFIIIPMLSMTIRRIRDTGHSPMLILLLLLPVVGWLFLLIILINTSKEINFY